MHDVGLPPVVHVEELIGELESSMEKGQIEADAARIKHQVYSGNVDNHCRYPLTVAAQVEGF